MSGKKNKNILFKSKKFETKQAVADFLRELAAKVETGSISIIAGDQTIEATIPENLRLELSLKETNKVGKGKKTKLEVEMEWYEGDRKNKRDFSLG